MNKLLSSSIYRPYCSLRNFNYIIYKSYSTNEKKFEPIEVLIRENELEITINQKTIDRIKSLKFNPHWLRLNCQSNKSRQPNTGQRTIDVDKIPLNLAIKEIKRNGDDLHIKWNDSSNQSDSILSINYLINNYPIIEESSIKKPVKNYKPCYELKFLNYLEFFDKNGNRNEEKIFEWLKCLAEYGICIVKNLPTENDMVKKLAELIAPVQRTIYGEIFDVKVDKTPINIAYSNAPLEFHMDLMYYESSPGLQFLHCLKFDSVIIGGESLFVDSFEIAEEFRRDHPKLFDALTRIPATFQKVHLDRARPVCMLYQRPHIVLNHRNKIVAVNWSPAFEGPLKNLTKEEIKLYYEAYLEFSKVINNHQKIIKYKLEPGDVACFNNRRILHARNGFVQNDGIRHFQGCYLNIDEFKSEVLAQEYKLKNESNIKTDKRYIDISNLELKDIMVGNQDYN